MLMVDLLTLTSLDKEPITIQAGSKENGYGADNGKRSDCYHGFQ